MPVTNPVRTPPRGWRRKHPRRRRPRSGPRRPAPRASPAPPRRPLAQQQPGKDPHEHDLGVAQDGGQACPDQRDGVVEHLEVDGEEDARQPRQPDLRARPRPVRASLGDGDGRGRAGRRHSGKRRRWPAGHPPTHQDRAEGDDSAPSTAATTAIGQRARPAEATGAGARVLRRVRGHRRRVAERRRTARAACRLARRGRHCGRGTPPDRHRHVPVHGHRGLDAPAQRPRRRGLRAMPRARTGDIVSGARRSARAASRSDRGRRVLRRLPDAPPAAVARRRRRPARPRRPRVAGRR